MAYRFHGLEDTADFRDVKCEKDAHLRITEISYHRVGPTLGPGDTEVRMVLPSGHSTLSLVGDTGQLCGPVPRGCRRWAQIHVWGAMPSVTYLVSEGGGRHCSSCAVVGRVAEP